MKNKLKYLIWTFIIFIFNISNSYWWVVTFWKLKDHVVIAYWPPEIAREKIISLLIKDCLLICLIIIPIVLWVYIYFKKKKQKKWLKKYLN